MEKVLHKLEHSLLNQFEKKWIFALNMNHC